MDSGLCGRHRDELRDGAAGRPRFEADAPALVDKSERRQSGRCANHFHNALNYIDASLVDLDTPAELLVLVADKFHRFFVGQESLIDPYSEWLQI